MDDPFLSLSLSLVVFVVLCSVLWTTPLSKP